MNQKLKKYLALAGSVTTVISNTDAQVVYTDVNPDFLFSGNLNTYSLDLNNDGIEDFTLTTLDTIQSYMSGSYSYKATIVGAAIRNPVQSNSWLINSASNFLVPESLNQGDVVGSSGVLGSAYSSSIGSPIVANIQYTSFLNGVPASTSNSTFGDFDFDQEGILGVKFNINGNYHFGWARIEVTSNGTVSIKDYAYDTNPNTSIIAGDNGAGLVGVQEQLNAVAISMLNNNISIENKGANDDCLMVLTNISGQQILEKQLKDKIELVDVSEFSTGIYLVKVISDSQSYVKKIYIK
jgi:hypothetical protein